MQAAAAAAAAAAASTYFAKHANQLTTDEAVWLAAMSHNPSMKARRWAATGQINTERVQWGGTWPAPGQWYTRQAVFNPQKNPAGNSCCPA